MEQYERQLNEIRRLQQQWDRELWRRRLSRRTVVRGSTLLALGALSGSALLEACGGGSKSPSTTGGSGAPSTFKDTTGTPDYSLGVPYDQAAIDAKWQQFPYVYKYNWRRYNWNYPLTKGGHQMAYGTTAPPSNYDLMHTANGVQSSLYYQGLWHAGIHQGLNLDSGSIEPDLALKTDHNADYTTWTFTLPQGVKFHNIAPVNGRELTADDVVFSFQRYIDTSIWSVGLQFVDKVTAPDKYTVRFDMKQPQATFDSIVALPYYLIFAKEAFDNQDLFKSKPIGTGAFFNESSVYQSKAEAVANPDFYMNASWMPNHSNVKLPFLDRVTLTYYPSDVSARSAFTAGNLDDYPITYLDPSVLKDVLSARPNVFVTCNSLWATFPLMIFWNYSNKLFQDVRIRRALSMAIDRTQLMNNVFNGAGVPGGAPVAFDLLGQASPPPLSDYGPYYQFNPQQAKQLLTEAGYPNGFNVDFEISSTLSQVIQFQVYKAVQQYWKQNLNVNVNFVEKDGLSVTNDSLNHSFSDLLQQGAVTGYNAYALISPLVHTKGGGNYGQASDPQLDALLDKLGAAASPDDTVSLTKQTLQRIQDQVTYIWIGWPQAITMTQPWIHGETQNLYAYLFYFGMENYRNLWITSDAPGGRGGQAV